MTVAPGERQYILSQIGQLAEAQVSTLWARAAELSSVDFAKFVADAFPDLIDPFAALAADTAAVWYDETPSPTGYIAQPGPLPVAEQMTASASWALGADGLDGLDRLKGTTQRAVFDSARNTVLHNVNQEQGARWARHASANACEFCALMATRGGTYTSKSAALGRGKKYHDHCHCIAVEIRPGQTYTPPDYVKEWEQAYIQASRETPKVGKYGAIDPKAVLAHMRANFKQQRAEPKVDEPDTSRAPAPKPDAPAPKATTPAAEPAAAETPAKKSRRPSPFAGKSSEDLLARFTDKVERGEIDDEFDALEAEITRRDTRAKAARDKRAADRDAKQQAQSDDYDRLTGEGVDHESAVEQAYGVPVAEQRRQNARSWLAGMGYNGKGLDDQVRAWHKDEAYQQWLGAEDACNGYLLSKAGERAGVDPRALWNMSEDRARKYGSEELRGWWDQNGRATVAEMKAQLLDPAELARIQSGRRDYLQ